MATVVKYLLFALVLSLFAGCSLLSKAVEDPEVKVVGMKVENVTLKGAKIYLDAEVYNPNRFDIKFLGYEYILTVQKHKVITGKTDEKFTLKAKDKVTITIPISLEFSEVFKVAKELIVKDRFAFNVTADLSLDLMVVGKKSFSVTKSGEVEIPKAKMLEEGVKKLLNW